MAKTKKGVTKPKWTALKHKGPQFHPPYKRLGRNLFKYKNSIKPLSKSSEEVVVMYAKYLIRMNEPKTVKPVVSTNFFNVLHYGYPKKLQTKQFMQKTSKTCMHIFCRIGEKNTCLKRSKKKSQILDTAASH